MKNKILTVTIIMLLALSLVIAQEDNQPLENLDGFDKDKDLEKYKNPVKLNDHSAPSDEAIQRQTALDRNELLRKTRSPSDRHFANSALTKDLIKEKFDRSVADKSIKLVAEKIGMRAYNLAQLEDSRILFSGTYRDMVNRFEELGFDLEKDLETNPDDLKIKGFHGLEWSENGDNVIGDGSNWLNLDDLPLGLSEIEYTGNRFELTLRNGNKITLEGGAINDEGVPKIFEKIKNDKGESIPLADIMMPEGEGHITLDFKTIRFGENTKMSIAEFDFSTPAGLKGESFIRVGENGFITKNVKFNRDGFINIDPSSNERIINIGNFQEIMHRDSVLKFVADFKAPDANAAELIRRNIAFSDPLETVVKTASFEDIQLDIVNVPQDFNDIGPGVATPVTSSKGKIEFQFSAEGKLTHVSKENKWIPISLSTHRDSALGEVYESSSPTVKRIIDKGRTEGISYTEIKETFYSTSHLSSSQKDIKIDSKYDDFVIMNGDNLLVGGSTKKGEGQITLRNHFNSLQGINAQAEIINGDRILPLIKDKDGNFRLGKSNVEGAFQYDIGRIETSTNGKFSKDTWSINNINSISGEIETRTLKDSSGTTIAGRSLILGPYGTNLEISTEIDSKDYSKIVSAGKRSYLRNPTQDTVTAAIGSKFTARFRSTLPISGLSVESSTAEDFVRKNVFKILDSVEGRKIAESKSLGDIFYSKITNDIIQQTVTDSISDRGTINLDSFSLEIVNNPTSETSTYYPPVIGARPVTSRIYSQGDPSLFVTWGNERKEVKLTPDSSEFFKGVLKAYWAAPDFPKGETTYYGVTTNRWPPQYVSRLGREIGPRVIGKYGENFFKEFKGKYFSESKK